MIRIRRATAEDIAQVTALLQAEGLAPVPRNQALSNLLLADGDSGLVGAIQLEVRGLRGLLHPPVVAPAQRDQGVDLSLLHCVIARAHELSLRQLFVIETDSGAPYSELGFASVGAARVPQAIRSLPGFPKGKSEPGAILCLELATSY